MQQLKGLPTNAIEFGFSHGAMLDVSTIALLPEIREMCAADKCSKYGKCWTCPPACGTLAQGEEKLRKFKNGILVQHTAQLEDDFDIENMELAGRTHQKLFLAYAKKLRQTWPKLLALGSGGCGLCPVCTCPSSPCKNPSSAVMSMEAFGIWVSDVCSKNGLAYNYGPQTITYTGCFLF